MNSEHQAEDSFEEISKSQRKRDADAIREFAARLVRLSPQKLEQLPLPDRLRQAIAECPPASTRGAHKRHIQYISKIIRKDDNLHTLEQLADDPPGLNNPHLAFCEQLISSFTEHADTLRQQYPAVSLQQARQLARAAGDIPAEDDQTPENLKIAKKKAAKAKKSLLKLLTAAE